MYSIPAHSPSEGSGQFRTRITFGNSFSESSWELVEMDKLIVCWSIKCSRQKNSEWKSLHEFPTVAPLMLQVCKSTYLTDEKMNT